MIEGSYSVNCKKLIDETGPVGRVLDDFFHQGNCINSW